MWLFQLMKIKIYPDHGSVCFGLGKKPWAFWCTKFALIYSKKFKCCTTKTTRKILGW